MKNHPASKRVVITVFLSFFFAAQTHADTKAESLVRYYSDGETTVASPHLKVKSGVARDSVTVGAGFAMDIITTSSVDVKSWSSTGTVKDNRLEYSGDVAFTLQDGSFSLGYIQSDENDYHSKAFNVGMSRDFFEKNTTLALGFNYSDEKVRSSKDSRLDEPVQVEMMSVSLTQVLSAISVAQILYDFRIEKGYLNGSYRVARVLQSDGSVVGLTENSPEIRQRNSVAFKYNYYFRSLGASLANSIRAYVDTWDVYSGTYEARLSKDYGKAWSMALNLRFYYQTAASFYQDKYTNETLKGFHTGNKTLSNYWSVNAGLRPTVRLGKFELYGKIEYYIERFSNFTDVGNPTDPTDDKPYSLNAMIFGLGLIGKF
jgi:hypothetical protein